MNILRKRNKNKPTTDVWNWSFFPAPRRNQPPKHLDPYLISYNMWYVGDNSI